jgi:hypothetical protein
MSFRRGNLPIKRALKGHIVLIHIDGRSVAVTPFGSLGQMNAIRTSRRAKSWTAKLRAAFALLFR